MRGKQPSPPWTESPEPLRRLGSELAKAGQAFTTLPVPPRKLLIAIPALNEEESIAATIERTLQARQAIVSHTAVSEVEVTVVSDGSTDRTVEIAQRYEPHIKIIVFPVNRGYGAAIQEAWRQSDAELLAFLDADGTCDPNFFVDLCGKLCDEQADVVLGCRLHAGSKMPWIRRLGNTLFALLVSLFSSKRVRDTASGMRVVRRESLWKLSPLPDGLHFTPAMSARALLSRGVRITEIDMPYHEREGKSKLQVGKDGLRFFRVILETAFLYRPSRPLGILGLALLAAAMALMIMPSVHYARHLSVLEWMIYRFVVSHFLGVTAFLLFSASYLTDKMVRIGLASDSAAEVNSGPLAAFLRSPPFWLVPLSLLGAGVALVIPSFLELVRTGATYEHWSRFIAMSFLFSVATILLVTRGVDYVLDLLANQLEYLRSEQNVRVAERTVATRADSTSES